MRILDVGSGTLPEAHKPRGQYNLDLCKRPLNDPANFVCADAHRIPFQSHLFDKVYFYDVIEHVQSPYRCLREIHRVLRPGGILELSTPNATHWRNFFVLFRRGRRKITATREHIYNWTHIELENLLWRTGFRNIAVRFVILPVTAQWTRLRYTIVDHLAFKIWPGGVTGRNMIVTGAAMKDGV